MKAVHFIDMQYTPSGGPNGPRSLQYGFMLAEDYVPGAEPTWYNCGIFQEKGVVVEGPPSIKLPLSAFLPTRIINGLDDDLRSQVKSAQVSILKMDLLVELQEAVDNERWQAEEIEKSFAEFSEQPRKRCQIQREQI